MQGKNYHNCIWQGNDLTIDKTNLLFHLLVMFELWRSTMVLLLTPMHHLELVMIHYCNLSLFSTDKLDYCYLGNSHHIIMYPFLKQTHYTVGKDPLYSWERSIVQYGNMLLPRVAYTAIPSLGMSWFDTRIFASSSL